MERKDYMLTDNEMRDIKTNYIGLTCVWVYLLLALGVYIIVANVLGEGKVDDGDPDGEFVSLKYALYVIGAFLLVFTYFVRKSITKTENAVSKTIAIAPLLNMSGSATMRYSIGIILCLALCQVVGIYGLVIFILCGDFISLYLLIGIAAVAQVYFRPKKQDIIDFSIQLKQIDREISDSNWKCPKCAKGIKGTDHFCLSCGHALD